MTIEFARTHHRPGSLIPTDPGKPYFIEKGAGDRAHLFGDLFTVYAGGPQTENTFNFFTCEGPKGDIIPAHSHPDTYEVFFLTQGAVRLFVEDTEGEQYEKLLTAGDFGFVPKNCPHAYRIERHHSQIVGVAAGPDPASAAWQGLRSRLPVAARGSPSVAPAAPSHRPGFCPGGRGPRH